MSKLENQFAIYYSQTPLGLAMERMLEVQIFDNIKIGSPSLDLGCGDGIFSSTTFDGEITCGLDSNPRELSLASKRNVYNTTVLADGVSLKSRTM